MLESAGKGKSWIYVNMDGKHMLLAGRYLVHSRDATTRIHSCIIPLE